MNAIALVILIFAALGASGLCLIAVLFHSLVDGELDSFDQERL